MSYDSVDEGAEIRACERRAEIARGWNQHGGGSRDLVAQFRFVAASSVSISRRGTSGWAATAAGRGLHYDHTQDACKSGPRPACTCDTFGDDDQRDRATCYLGLPISNSRAWVSGRRIRRAICFEYTFDRLLATKLEQAYEILNPDQVRSFAPLSM